MGSSYPCICEYNYSVLMHYIYNIIFYHIYIPIHKVQVYHCIIIILVNVL